MSEPELRPALEPAAKPRAPDGLWGQAPAWRNLTFVACGLTVAAAVLALPPLVEGGSAPQPLPAHAGAPPSGASGSAAALAPTSGGRTPPPTIIASTPAQQRQPGAPAPAAPPPAAPAPTQLASAQPAPADAPKAAPAAQPTTCMLDQPAAPAHFGEGIVTGVEDHDASLARIQVTQRMLGGLIDPAYVDNQRVIIRRAPGRGLVVLVPRGMTVAPGDRVTFQGGYRNMKLPCNYIPNLITSDLGPAPPQQQPAAGPEAQKDAGEDATP